MPGWLCRSGWGVALTGRANLRKISTKNPAAFKPNIPAFERLLKRNSIGIPGRTKRAPQYMTETYAPIKVLPPDVLNKVARDNAVRLYGLGE